MLALAYDAGLRREELCSLRTDDLDPAYRTLRARAENQRPLGYEPIVGLHAALQRDAEKTRGWHQRPWLWLWDVGGSSPVETR